VTISGPGFEDRVVLAATGAEPYARVFEIEGTDTGPVKLGGPREATVSLPAEGAPAAAEPAFELGDLTIRPAARWAACRSTPTAAARRGRGTEAGGRA
jgi:hypothetical protein